MARGDGMWDGGTLSIYLRAFTCISIYPCVHIWDNTQHTFMHGVSTCDNTDVLWPTAHVWLCTCYIQYLYIFLLAAI